MNKVKITFSLLACILSTNDKWRNIVECFHSQNYSKSNLILVVDGEKFTSEKDRDDLKRYVKKDNRIKVYTKGKYTDLKTAKYNALLKYHKDYIIIVNPNDTISSDIFVVANKILNTDNQIEVIRHQVTSVGDSQYQYSESFNPDFPLYSPVSGIAAFKKWAHILEDYTFWGSYIIKFDLLNKFYPIDINTFDDYALLPAIITSAKRVFNTSKYLYQVNLQDRFKDATNKDEVYKMMISKCESLLNAYNYSMQLLKIQEKLTDDVTQPIINYSNKLLKKKLDYLIKVSLVLNSTK